MQIVQLPDKVIFLYEYMHNFRVIYTDGRAIARVGAVADGRLGRPVGRRHARHRHRQPDGSDLARRPREPAQRRAARDRALAAHQREQLWYEETLDDPKFYTKPWTVGWAMPLAPSDWVIMEYACTDNNKDLYDGQLRPGTLDGSLRDGTAIGPPAPPRR